MFRRVNLFREGSNINQIMCAIMINLPVFAYGTSMGWMSPMSLLLQSENSPKGIPMTDTEVSWMASITYLIAAFSIYFLAVLGDTIGRKRTLIFEFIIGTFSWIFMLCSMEIWSMIVARMLVGVIMAASYLTCPSYTKEISSDKIRGSLGCLPMVFHTSGNLFLYVIGDLLEYHTILWIGLAISTVIVILLLGMPESPSYLVKNGKIEEATETLAWLRCRKVSDSSVQEEINCLLTEQNNDEQTPYSGIRALWSDKVLNKAFKIALLMTVARDMCGVITCLNFAGEIFTISSEGTGIQLTPNQQAMVLGTVQVIAAAIATSVIELSGRKVLFSGTACLSGISMLVLASWFVAKKFDIILSSWIPVITLCICIFCDSAGLLPVSSVLSNELFSFKYRSSVLAITIALVAIIDFFQLIFFKSINKYLGIYITFYLFGIICISSAIYVFIVLPETKGRSLKDIYKDLDKTTEDK